MEKPGYRANLERIDELFPKLKPCPFCGASMEIGSWSYPGGAKRIEPSGWHDDNCPLDYVLWYFDDEWAEEMITESWNRRVEA